MTFSLLRPRVIVGLAYVIALVACGGSDGGLPPGMLDAGGDLGPLDLGEADLGVSDLGARDLGADGGPSEFLASCEPCALDAECDPTARCLALPSGQRACVPTCDVELPTCPRAFECTNAASGGTYVCSPINGSCCIDEDADGYGAGIGCAGLDCNDVEATVNPAAGEQCNNVDDDCDGTVDGFAADCGDQRCGEAATAGTYEEIGPGSCEVGACVEGVRTPCGLYACEAGGSSGDRCATACIDSAGADDDSLCATRAHCEAGVCVDDVVDGGMCDEDTDCVGAHCDNGFCCDGGICCNAASDCPVTGGFITVCDSAATCQGSTGAPACRDFICGTVDGVANDSACTTETIANECGFFLPVRCTAATEQAAPVCPSTCVEDAECDAIAHCDTICLPDRADGESCNEPSDCTSGYCNNGICCSGGDCCVRPGDCPASYANPARCEAPEACQGTRDAAVCVGFVCNTMTNVPDDSACAPSVLANACGSYPARFCTGAVAQPAPMCASSCVADAECDPEAHCDGSACVPDLPSGRMCDEASDCLSGYCGNGFCCSGGDCCASPSDCPASYSTRPDCTNPATCQGSRNAAVCVGFVCNTTTNVPDDSACTNTVLASECGSYPSRFCTGASDQPPPACATACTVDADCDADAHCDADVCVPDVASGRPCDEASDCVSDYCNNGLCCAGGDCCASPSDCPASYSRVPSCDVPNACQGTRDSATCVGFVCNTVTNVPDDSACNVGVLADACGSYPSRFCTGAVSQVAPTCATACTVDADCDAEAHCDGGACVPDLPSGRMCDEASDCLSAFCGNGFCCSGGDCCSAASDCPASYSSAPRCDNPLTCQGTRDAAVCVGFVCNTTPSVADDSACSATVLASDCGSYPSRFCTGAVTQTAPVCAAACTVDGDCDADAHCDANACVPDIESGRACDEASDCISGYCNNGLCCSGGDCCVAPSDCPASYSSAARCEAPAACQGARDAAVCVGFVCNTVMNVPDDSACNASVLADACGSYPARFCSGGTDQPAPVCASACTSDAECDLDAHCDANACVPDLDPGRMCDEASDCRSGYCNNGFCCAGGDCCSAASDCPAAVYGRPSVCASAMTCQGDRIDPICTATKQCATGPTIPDDSGCVGLEASNCGAYPSVSCTSAVTQTMPMCAAGCTSDAQCDATAFCNTSGLCVSRGVTGAACGGTGECASGLSCVDGVCCTSACTGTCRACNVPGSEGTCTNVPNGTDPSNECGSVSCAAYFTAPSGATVGAACNQVANVPAGEVFCTGGGTCQGAATLCASRTLAGAEVLDCDNTCQILSGCNGTTAGRCDAYTPPLNTQSCGIGQCANTVPICNAGALLTCMPRASSAEMCDDVDNDCDGQTDEGLSGDSLEPNNTCTAPRTLPAMGTFNEPGRVSIQTLTPTIYGTGDVDVYRVDWVENDASCGCPGFANTDEDYRLVATLTVPANAGSYQVCVKGNGSCGDGTCTTVAAGATGMRDVVLDGLCLIGTTDSGTYWVTVRGVGAPAFECSPYTLRLELQQACVGGN